ncbi:hypothetical protein BOTBODRAFT_187353 [Botryobasidium botryosum FD-172 SS1]|uniref:Uncharacterized protein n=1 Tax=Botryobasidium botryosum (strain FD-172 SS1) TaxID=930990 RepID=A0A067MHE0_BOTB1|nr:hypothetical protein BOTBODRAFT_187353 [Botryobasidium botryosum FD-172 SS1]
MIPSSHTIYIYNSPTIDLKPRHHLNVVRRLAPLRQRDVSGQYFRHPSLRDSFAATMPTPSTQFLNHHTEDSNSACPSSRKGSAVALECSAEGKDVQAEVKRLLLEIWEMARAASDQPESSESLDKRVTELLEVELEGLREEDRVAMGVLNEQKRGLEELQAQNRRKMPAFCLKIYASLSQSRISFVISGSDHRSRLRKCLEFLDDNIRTTPTCFTYALSLRLLSLAFVTDNIPSFTFTTVRMT